MTQERTTAKTRVWETPASTRLADSYYGILGLSPSASCLEIRRAYRELSKQYHPDTTQLPPDIARERFQRLNEAYRTLSSPEQRPLYDLQIGRSPLRQPASPPQPQWTRSATLDPRDRPLSAGEVFVLFLLGLTFAGCILLAIAISLLRGDPASASLSCLMVDF